MSDNNNGFLGVQLPSSFASGEEAEVRAAGEGLLVENFSRQAAASTAILTNGTVYYVAIGLSRLIIRQPIRTISLGIASAGASVTRARVGLYDATGVLLVQSDDQSAFWMSTGVKTIALQTPFRVPAIGLYYVAVIAKADGTLPAVARGTAISMLSLAVPGGLPPYATQPSQLDLPVQAVFSAGTFAPWMGLG